MLLIFILKKYIDGLKEFKTRAYNFLNDENG